jgi:hypothetical protein
VQDHSWWGGGGGGGGGCIMVLPPRVAESKGQQNEYFK